MKKRRSAITTSMKTMDVKALTMLLMLFTMAIITQSCQQCGTIETTCYGSKSSSKVHVCGREWRQAKKAQNTTTVSTGGYSATCTTIAIPD